MCYIRYRKYIHGGNKYFAYLQNNFENGGQEWFKWLKTDNMDVGANLAYNNDITVTKFQII